jgi:hypothetical protein
MTIETKYLILYLISQRVSIQGYNEKKDLALLIVNYNCLNEQDNPINLNLSQSVREANRDTLTSGGSVQPPVTAENSSSSNSSSETSSLNYQELEHPSPSPSQSPPLSNTANVVTLKKRASLSDLKSILDIDGLSVRQIKEILTFNFVDYSDCFEKKDLIERIQRLYNDSLENNNNNTIKVDDSGGENSKENGPIELNLCKICMDQVIDCVLLNCGHMCSCVKCGKLLSECPICRQYVVKVIRVFKC